MDNQIEDEDNRIMMKAFPTKPSYGFREKPRGPVARRYKRDDLPKRMDSYIDPPSDSPSIEVEEPEPEVNAGAKPRRRSLAVRRIETFFEPKTKRERIMKHIDDWMSSSVYEFAMGIITVYIMYADYVRVLTVDRSQDDYFYAVSLGCIFIFLLEIVLLSIVRRGYIFRFFFWMDLISTISTFMEIPWVIRDTLGLEILSGQNSMVKAGRASRISSRATKVIRIIRLIRIVRISKIYKYASQTISDKFSTVVEQGDPQDDVDFEAVERVFSEVLTGKNRKSLIDLNSPTNRRSTVPREEMREFPTSPRVNFFTSLQTKENETSNLLIVQQQFEQQVLEENNTSPHVHRTNNSLLFKSDQQIVKDKPQEQTKKEEEIVIQETRVGKRLSQLITEKAILLIFTIIVAFPLFEYSTYWSDTTSFNTGLNILEMNQRSSDFQFQLEEYIKFHHDFGIGSIAVNDQDVYAGEDYSRYRQEELKEYLSDTERSWCIVILFEQVQLDAILDILRTTFVVIVMVTAAILFCKDATDLVVTPIETMLSKVQRIAKNPLEAAKIEEDEEIIEQEIRRSNDDKKLNKLLEQNTYETYVLEKLIIKTGALLAVGFGEAGANIIAENISKGDAVNPLIAGNKMVGIFGFCDIRNFTDMTEILQERVMLFVNEIAQIVHQNVHNMNGSANKNIGDAFLLVWKLPSSIIRVTNSNLLQISKQSAVSNFADLALLSFVKVVIQIRRSYSLHQLASEPAIQERLPGYSVKLGMGLHLGWAIEGAIGSHFKIDASYLSPHVNMSARLETATKQYGSLILLSGAFYNALSVQVQGFVRFIDKVTVKGSEHPMDLFTFDMDLSKLVREHGQRRQVNPNHQKIIRYFKRRRLALQYQKILKNNYHMINQYLSDPDLVMIRKPYTKYFFAKFEEGMVAYVRGEWKDAYAHFEAAQLLVNNDGPSMALMKHMSQFNLQAPADWKGYRQLLEK